jgi:hypothetical protein
VVVPPQLLMLCRGKLCRPLLWAQEVLAYQGLMPTEALAELHRWERFLPQQVEMAALQVTTQTL